MDGDKNAVNKAGFGAAEENNSLGYAEWWGSPRGVLGGCAGGVDRRLGGRKRGLLVARGRRIAAHCVGL